MSENGKGDRQRPCDKKKFDENFERIFSKKENRPLTNEEIMKKYPDGAYGPGIFCPYNPFTSGTLKVGVDLAASGSTDYSVETQADIDYYRRNVMRALKIPASLLQDTGSANLACIARNNPNFKAAVEAAAAKFNKNK